MPLNTAGRNALLSGGLGNAVTRISLHTANPGTNGANEVSGGAYARQAVTWSSPSNGQISNSGTLSFEVPASTTVIFVGFWDNQATPVFYGYAPLTGSPKGFGTADASNDTITSNGHGLADNDRVVLSAVNAESLPTGLSEGTAYYVVQSTANTFKLSTTQGGTAIDITANGELLFQKVVPETFGAAGQLNFSAGQLVLDATAV